jgi:multidrug efflux pump subunit AcrB
MGTHLRSAETSRSDKSSAISASINNYLLEKELGGASESMAGGTEKRTYLTLEGNNKRRFRWDDIPVAKASGRIIHLTDVAKVKLKDQRPQRYFRINGLNR